MKNYIIEKKAWYNKYLHVYQTILTINDIPDDLAKYIKRDTNVNISDFTVRNDFCNSCFYYFTKEECGNCCAPMQLCDIPELSNMLIVNRYEILYKETKLMREYNKNLIFVINKLI